MPRQQFAVHSFNYEANFVGLEWMNWLMRFTPKGERIVSGLIRPSESFQTENQRSIQRNFNSHFV